MRFRIGDKVVFTREYQSVFSDSFGKVYTILDIKYDKDYKGCFRIKCDEGYWTSPIYLILYTTDTIFEKI